MKKAFFIFLLLFVFIRPVVAVEPDEISGLYLWFNPDLSPYTEGATVSSVMDYSGNNYTGITNPLFEPTFRENVINGHDALDFQTNEVSNIFNTTSPVLTDYTFYIVAQSRTNDSAYRSPFNIGRNYLITKIPSTNQVAFNEPFNTPYYYNFYWTINDWHIVRIRRDGSNIYYRIDEEPEENTINSTILNTGYSMGAWFENGNQNWGGYIGEVIIYNHALTAQDQSDIYNYLSCKYFNTNCSAPTNTPTPTPTPILDPYYIPESDNKCSVWYNNNNELGNGVWHIQNNYSEDISIIDVYGYNWQSVGWGVINGNATLFDSYTNFGADPQVAHSEWSAFDPETVVSFESNGFVVNVVCTYPSYGQSTAFVPAGKTISNPDNPYVGGSATIPISCENLAFNVPVINWSFEFPNWGCQLIQFINSLFAINTSATQANYDALVTFANTKTPTIYINALNGLNFGDSLGDTDTIPPFYMEWTPQYFTNGIPENLDPVVIDIEASTFEPIQPFITYVRTFLQLLLWVGMLFYFVNLSKRFI